MLKERGDAFQLLHDLEAPDRLVRHAQLVLQAADELISEFHTLGVTFDERTVELGAILHDAGKIRHPHELSAPGNKHEKAGEELLLAHGVQPDVARICASHGAGPPHQESFEEQTVALADKLWKGKRDDELELSVIDAIATKLGNSRWDIFERLDTAFEKMAAGGAERVQRSMTE
jgi:putative nucleotidyltransferase with HDIG domain